MKRSVRSACAALMMAFAMVGCGDDGPSGMLDDGAVGRGDGGTFEGDGAVLDDGSIPAEPDAASGCGAVTSSGACSGTTARWCESDTVREQDCASSSQVCGATQRSWPLGVAPHT